MRLIELRSNKKSFRTIPFNRTGISLIVGKKHQTNETLVNRKNTYNSVGKSLSIALVHFCLGSNPNLEFEEKLNDWEFTLEFEIGEKKFIATRKCKEQNKVFLNEKEYSLQDYKDYLESKVFKLPEPIKFLKFRSLISRFIRPNKFGYNSYYKFINKEQDYPQLLNNAFLLGLDPYLVQRKAELKDEIDDIDKRRKGIENDEIMKSFFEEGEDIEIDIYDLKQNIELLENRLKGFQVAEDYHEIVEEADHLKRQIQEYENRAERIKRAIYNIDQSLEIQPDVSRTKIENFYKQARLELPEMVIKRLDEVQSFNEKLTDNRGRRLFKEKQSFEKELHDISEIIRTLGRKKDEKLGYLNTKGALDEFTNMNDQLRSFKLRLEKLEQYKNLINEFKNKQEEFTKEFSDENIKTNNYLNDQSDLIRKNIKLFKFFADQFYGKKRAGIEIHNNDGKNKNRFDIKAKIDDDKGDGVNYIKIFCYDWTMLKGQNNHTVKFLFHDGRLLSEIDPRQVATLFEIAHKQTQEFNLQYIISANENVLEATKQYLGEEKYSEIIEENTVLELTDESEAHKLLGVQVELDYDKE
ncbi:hypothetical protein AWW67_13415 [Roseivirga seohaensis]|uniref:DUF2326 domain-containing protein n=1 Tax=Roseivirga seohaensis TaxID=1914963 RepID=A0A150XKV1_9BACT|nr:DUF2326 domain-containing protein [Roseivirga seohaensis]KYG79368.1 hypothetical protein AWW67_13415 [Roseivirga seohaensis]